MTPDTGKVSLFAEGRAGAAFVLWLCFGIGLAAAAGLLLPWPPDVGGSVMAALVFLVCGAVVWNVGGSREVGFDPATKTVIERMSFAGVPRERRLVLGADARVEVTQKMVKVARANTEIGHPRTSTDYDVRPHYRVALRGGTKKVVMDIVPDVLEAERRAVEVATHCAVGAVRSGYTLEIGSTASPVASSGTGQVITVRNAAGAQSAIAARQ